jgi:hypothetical protein
MNQEIALIRKLIKTYVYFQELQNPIFHSKIYQIPKLQP